ncbi:MAG TPA: TetR/AcrR family transcriptional regulator [Terriglobales bacterium]|nr:TetR/AcrR family transcriptional regulator [Terriglobales bacterium]
MLSTQPQSKNSTEDRIIEAAVQLFSRDGFNGTSTREIARLASVNEVTIFRYFARKKDLFWAAVDSRASRLRLGKALQEGLKGNASPAIVLEMIFEFLVETVQNQPELLRLLRFSALELDAGVDRICRKHLAPIFESLVAYLGRSIETQSIRRVDPVITALGFAATVMAHYGLYGPVTGAEFPYASRDEAIAAYTEYWLNLLLPPTGTAPVDVNQIYKSEN